MQETIHTIKTKEGEFNAYGLTPDNTPRGALIVLPEIYGVNDPIKAICAEFASEGFLVLAHEVFWRLERHVSLSPAREQDQAKAFDLMGRYDLETGMKDLQALIDYARALPECNGKVATLGFCMGGKLAYFAAARTNADACISYYGVGIEDALAEAKTITAPSILHIASLDAYVPQEAQDAIHKGLDAHAAIALYDYDDCDHAFARIGGDNYVEHAAKTAHARSLALLKEVIG